jgi:hypothetical protein
MVGEKLPYSRGGAEIRYSIQELIRFRAPALFVSLISVFRFVSANDIAEVLSFGIPD